MITGSILLPVLLIVVTLNLTLGGVILLHGPRKLSSLLYGLIIVSVSIWGMGIAGFYSDFDLNWIAITHSAALIVAFLFSSFSFTFPRNFIQKPKRMIGALMLPAAVFLYLLFFTDHILGETIGLEYEIHIGYLYYQLLLLFYFLLGFYVLYKQYVHLNNETEKKQLVYIFIGAALSAVFALITNLIFPYVGIFYLTWLGPVFTLFLVLSVGYAILRHQLFNLKVIATEVFIFALWFVIFIRTIFAEDVHDFLLSLSLLGATILIGMFLIRSVLKEVRQRERIEHLATRLEEANEKLKELDQMKTEFLSLATHQIRSPLTSMRGYVSLMQEGEYGKVPESFKEPLDILRHSTDSLVKIVNDFLNVSRIEQGRMKYDLKEHNLYEVVETILKEYEPSVEKKGLHLDFEAEEGAYMVTIDENKFEQVIGNIIDNAVKYTPEGKITVELSRPDKETVRVAVHDTGVGIDPDEISKLFTKFSRAKGASEVNVTGTGLGMYLAKKITEDHGGTISVESDGNNKGSTFIVDLPSA